MLIDDEVAFTQMLKLNLERTGRYEVKIENKGALGLSAAKAFKPDLILLDIIMPDMDGSDIASELRKDDSVKNIPVVFLTALVKKEELNEKGTSISGHLFLAKAVSLNEIIGCVEKNIIRQ